MELLLTAYIMFGLYYAGKTVKRDEDPMVTLVVGLVIVGVWPAHLGYMKNERNDDEN